jgi:hypothetical protein
VYVQNIVEPVRNAYLHVAAHVKRLQHLVALIEHEALQLIHDQLLLPVHAPGCITIVTFAFAPPQTRKDVT